MDLSSLSRLVPRGAACCAFFLALAAAGCTTLPADSEVPATDAAESSDGWDVLFDGGDLSAWRGYRQDAVPAAWRVEDGTLHFDPEAGNGDIVTRETYDDFELALDWKISACGNSGIFYRGAEGDEEIWHTAPEMQVLDDACHPDARFPSHRAGSNYDLYAATPGVVRPAGEWNEVRIVARGPHIEHWLNGEKVAEYELQSAGWKARVAASKFREQPRHGSVMDGLIALQDHDDPVWYRDIRIRRLDG